MTTHVRSAGAAADPKGGPAFAHMPPELRWKVLDDLAKHTTAEGSWNTGVGNGRNDYQRHLFALFLKAAGADREAAVLAVATIAVDVLRHKRMPYAEQVLDSALVGWPPGWTSQSSEATTEDTA